MSKSIGKDISKNLSGKYSQKLLDHAKQSATDVLKTSPKRVIQKTTETAVNLIGNKFADKITKGSKSSPQNSLEIVQNENDKETTKPRYVTPEKMQKTIDDLSLI